MDLLPFDEYVRSLNRKRMSAGVLYHDDQDRVLLVEPSYKPTWDIPGGACEANEPPWRTASREVEEELGIALKSTGELLVIDYMPTNAQMPEGLAFIFNGGSLTDADVEALEITDPEIVSVELVSLTTALERVSPSLRRRLPVAVEAARTHTLTICNDGVPATL